MNSKGVRDTDSHTVKNPPIIFDSQKRNHICPFTIADSMNRMENTSIPGWKTGWKFKSTVLDPWLVEFADAKPVDAKDQLCLLKNVCI